MNRHTLSRHRPAKARSASSRKMTGRLSIPEPPAIESRSRGVLDTPHARGMTTCCVKLMSTVTARLAANVTPPPIAYPAPRRRMVAGPFFAAQLAVDAGFYQTGCYDRAQQQMIEPQSRVARPAVALVIPEGEHWF